MAGIWPYLVVEGGSAAVDYYTKAFDARPVAEPILGQDGKRVLNAQLECFGTSLMVMDAFPEHGDYEAPPTRLGHTTAHLHVQLGTPAEVDRWIGQSKAHGAEALMGPELTFWGDYYGQVRDPFGHVWSFGATPAKD